MLIHSLVLLLLPIPFLAEIDGPANNFCNLCKNDLGTHLRFSAHLTVSSEGQNEPEMLMRDGALISIDCSNPSKTMQKVLVFWTPDDPTTQSVKRPSVTSKLFLDNSALFTTEPTSSTEITSKSTMAATSEEITSTYSTITTDLTTPTDTTTEGSTDGTKTDTSSTFTVTNTINGISTTHEESTLEETYFTTPTTTTTDFTQEMVSTETSTQTSSTITANLETDSTLLSQIFTEDTFSTETFSDATGLFPMTSTPSFLTEKSTVETDLTTFTVTSTFDPSSTTELTKETELHSSISTSTEVSTNVMTESEELFSHVPEDSESGPQTTILGQNQGRVLNNPRSKRSAEPGSNSNEMIFYFKQTNTTYFLNRLFISFKLDSLGIQYIADLSGLRLWVTPNGLAYECPGGENFTLHENSILTLKNIKIAAFIPNSCRYPETPSFTCGTPLPEPDMTNGSDPTINGVLIAGIAMGSLSLMGVAIIAFRRCCTWLRAPKPRPLTL